MTTFAARYLSLEKETGGYGVEPSSTQTFGEIDDESFNPSFDVLYRNDMTKFTGSKQVFGKQTAEGSFNLPLQPDGFVLRCLHGVIGQHTKTDANNGTMSMTASSALPSFTFRVGRDTKEHTFTGQVVESISVSASMGEYAMMSVSTMGKKESAVGSLGSPTYAYAGDAAHFAAAFVNFEELATDGDFASNVSSIDFEIKTNRDMDNSYGLGDETCTRAPPITLVEITGSITFNEAVHTANNNSITFAEVQDGHEQDGAASTPAISVLFQVDSNNKLRFDFPHVVYEAPSTNVSGRDSQTMSVPFTARLDPSDANMMLLTYVSSATDMNVDLDA